ncbi:unnamed protein product, partial [Closterium sp. Yama58-4]
CWRGWSRCGGGQACTSAAPGPVACTTWCTRWWTMPSTRRRRAMRPRWTCCWGLMGPCASLTTAAGFQRTSIHPRASRHWRPCSQCCMRAASSGATQAVTACREGCMAWECRSSTPSL